MEMMTKDELVTLSEYERRMLGNCKAPLPHDVVTYLAEHEDWVTRSNAAKRPELTPVQLDALTRDVNPSVRLGCLKNPHITDEQIQYLTNDENDSVRIDAACSSKLLVTQVIAMLDSGSDEFRNGLASIHHEPAVLAYIFQMLPTSDEESDLEVLQCLAANEHMTHDFQWQLFNYDSCEEVQLHLANNHTLNWKLLFRLGFESQFEDVRTDACAMIESLDQDDIAAFFRDGIRLSAQIINDHDNHQPATLGDCLLRAGLSDIYQIIQALELQVQMDASIDHQPSSVTQVARTHKSRF